MAGTIFSGTYTTGIVLNPTQNPATVAAAGYIYKYAGTALLGIAGTAWTVDNLGRIAGKGLGGVGVSLVSGGTIVNGQGGANSGTITGAAVGVALLGAGAVTNYGTIAGGLGVALAAGDTLVNAGTITGSGGTAVVFAAGAGDLLVLDPGAVFTGTVDVGGGTIELAAGGQAGTVAGFGSGFVDFGGVKLDAGATWQAAGTMPSLINDGTVLTGGSLTLGPVSEDGGATGVIELTASTVAQSAELTGAVAAGQTILFAGRTGTATLDNPGAFAGDVSGFQQGDTLDFAGVVADGYSFAGGVLTLTSAGVVVAQVTLTTPYAKSAFALAGDGKTGTDVTVTPVNPPNIFSGVYTTGVVLTDPATQNPATVTATGYITNTTSAGVGVLGSAGFAWTLGNYGTITGGTHGTGVSFASGGSIRNTAGGLIEGQPQINYAYVSNGIGIAISGGAGTIANSGTIRSGISIAGGAGTVANSATITGGISLESGGTVGNSAGAVLAGAVGSKGSIGAALGISGAAGSLTNLGTIEGGVTLGAGGSVTNGQTGAPAALVTGGVLIAGAGTVANSGQITNLGSGVVLDGPGVVSNSGVIDGSSVGVGFGGLSGDTLINAGSIAGSGGPAVQFGSGKDLLVVDPGAVFSGTVDGGGGSNTLELASAASAGTLSGLGTGFTNFTTAKVDPGAVWQLAGAAPALTNDGTVIVAGGNSLALGAVGEDGGDNGVVDVGGSVEFAGAVAAAQTVAFTGAGAEAKLDQPSGFAGAVTGFAAGDTLDLAGVAATTYSYAAGVLTLLEGTTQVAQMRLATTAASPSFSLAPDGGTGTLVTLAGQAQNIFSGTYTNGIVLSNPAQNQATVTSTGVVSYAAGDAIYGAAGTAWTLTNYGSVSGYAGIGLSSGGSIVNAGSIAGAAFGVYIGGAAGAVVNKGSIAGTGSTGVGIQLYAGGLVSNSGTISGVADALIGIAPMTVVNQGLMTAEGSLYSFGIFLAEGGLVDNQRTIAGSDAGLVFNGAGSVHNDVDGTILGTGSNGIGVYLGASGITLDNAAGAVISGRYGVLAGAGDTTGDTIVNAGTITGTGGTAIALGNGGDRLVVDPGAVFVGYVVGGRHDVIELAAGNGVLDGLGSQFVGFGTVVVDAGARWLVSGGGSKFVNDGSVTVDGALSFGAVTHDKGQHGVIDLGNGGTAEFTASVAKGETLVFTDNSGALLLDSPLTFKATISGFAAGDVIDLVGLRANRLAFANHQLIVTEHGNPIASLTFAGHYTANQFALSPDGNGGTDITLLGPVAAPFWTLQG